jgi:hypothetical protein
MKLLFSLFLKDTTINLRNLNQIVIFYGKIIFQKLQFQQGFFNLNRFCCFNNSLDFNSIIQLFNQSKPK